MNESRRGRLRLGRFRSRLRGALRERWAAGLGLRFLACTSSSTPDKTPSVDASADASHGEFVTNQRVFYSDGLHNENTVMSVQGDRVLLAFRGGESGQIGSGQARINVY